MEEVLVRPVYFDVPEGKAVSTLREAALQADVDIMFAGRLLRKVNTPAVNGEYAPLEVFEIMLAGTVFVAFQHQKSGVYIIKKNSFADNAKVTPNPVETTQMNTKKRTLGLLLKGVLTLGFANSTNAVAQESSGEGDIVTLSPFEVKGDAGNSLWTINQSSGGTRIAVPVKELPFSLDIVTSDFMDDFMISGVDEVLAHVANATEATPHTGSGSGNAIRGFGQFYQLRDGFYRNGVVGKTLIDRVEVVKGPYAAIYGRGEPGGVINYIPKRPVFGEYSGKASMQYGENSTYRAQWEQNSAIGKNTAILVAGSYFEREFDLIWTHERSVNYGASFAHRFSEDTKLTLEYENMFRRNNRGRPFMDIRINGTEEDGTRFRYTGEWAWDFYEEYGWVNNLGPNMFSDRTLETINATLEHRFADNVNFRVAVNDSSTGQHYDYNGLGSNTILVNPTTGEFEQYNSVPWPAMINLDSESKAVQADLTVDFDIGDTKHTTLFTFDYSDLDDIRYRLYAPRGRDTDTHIVDYPVGGVPNYLNDAGGLHGPRTDVYIDWNNSISFKDTPEYYTRVAEDSLTNYEISGLFMMHRVKLLDGKMIVMLGGRYDEAKTTVTASDTVTEVDDFTYNVGVNYKLTSRTTAYASHATSFNPKGFTYSHTGLPMPNEKGEGSEVGVRTSLMGDKLDVGASYFHIERQNVRTTNPDFDSTVDDPLVVPTHIPGGLDRAEGYELYVNGKLTDQFGIRASIGIIDTEHVENINDWIEGWSFRNVPDWNWSVSGNYRFAEGALKGLRLSASYRAAGEARTQDRAPTAADMRSNLLTEESAFLDFAASYSWKTNDANFKHTVRLAAKNVLDDVYIIAGGYLSDSRQLHFSYSLEY
ncbi:TonB-dependent receptor [Puniceicoccaceae bacterium K14]|nr:TonB-dependent receptor [Puniceicoccaceae bacterium K14]